MGVGVNRIGKVRSFITNLADGDKVEADAPTLVKGIAFDGGYGISAVLMSWWGAARLSETSGCGRIDRNRRYRDGNR